MPQRVDVVSHLISLALRQEAFDPGKDSCWGLSDLMDRFPLWPGHVVCYTCMPLSLALEQEGCAVPAQDLESVLVRESASAAQLASEPLRATDHSHLLELASLHAPSHRRMLGGAVLGLSQNCGRPRPPAPSRGCGEHTISVREPHSLGRGPLRLQATPAGPKDMEVYTAYMMGTGM